MKVLKVCIEIFALIIFIFFNIGCSKKNNPVIAPHITINSISSIEEHKDGKPYPYYLLKPAEYDEHEYRYPLFILLHGAGELRDTLSPIVFRNEPFKVMYNETNNSIDKSKISKLNLYLKSSFVLIPQTNNKELWQLPIDTIVDRLLLKFPIDDNRIYLTGISLGGRAVWSMAGRNPGLYTALVPVCGNTSASGKKVLAGKPIWAFHAFDDNVVPIDSSINPCLENLMGLNIGDIMKNYPHRSENKNYSAKKDLIISFLDGGYEKWHDDIYKPTGLVNYTLYKDGGHDSWTRAFTTEAMWKWLYTQGR